jgi:branched-chain amino acid transport system permease protein
MIGQMLWLGIELGTVYVLISLGLTFVFGVMKIVNFAHGELCMLGSMMVYTLMTYLKFKFFTATICSIAFVAIWGIFINRLAIRPVMAISPVAIMLSTLSFSFIMVHTGNFVWSDQARRIDAPFQKVVQISGISVSGQTIMIMIIGVIAVTALYLFLNKTRLGKLMQATSQQIVGAKLIGINVNRIYDYTLMIASGLAALGGIFTITILYAFPSMGENLLPIGFAVAIVGGMGSIRGCIVVGLLMGIMEAVFGHYISMYYRPAFVFGLMIIALFVKPEGLFARRGS